MEILVGLAFMLLVVCAAIGVAFKYPLPTLAVGLVLIIMIAGGCALDPAYRHQIYTERCQAYGHTSPEAIAQCIGEEERARRQRAAL